MSDGSHSLIDRCTAAQLKELLALACGARPGGQSLLDWARRPADLARLLTELCEGEEASGEILLSTLCDPETPLAVLRGIKELAKRLLKGAKGEPQRAAATVLYHAAVAAAFARHGVNVSMRAIEARWSLYEDLAAVFAEHPLGGLFRQAAERIANAAEGTR